MAKASPKTRSARTKSPPNPPESGRDYVQIALDYAAEAVADTDGNRFGSLIRKAAQRFLDDLKRAEKADSGFIFDAWEACNACDFIEKLPHVEGVWETPTIVLHPSHVWFVVQLFGFRKPDGTRRFTSALFAVARKNAKSTLAAAILLYCLCYEDEPGAQVISAATTGDQARIIFNVAKKMATKTPALREAFGLECWANSVSRVEIGGSFKSINAKASTQDGLNPSHAGLDEIHAHKDADLLNVLQSAAGARRSPLWLFTTTEGYLNPGPWGEIRVFARQVLDGVVEADHFLALFFAIDKDDDELDESVWVKANPLMDVNPHLMESIRKEAIEAKAMPSKMAEFRIKRCNRQSAAADSFIHLDKWDNGSAPVDLSAMEGLPCWAGLDLAATTDLCSLRMVWADGDKRYTWGRRWVPSEAVKHRTERQTVDYAGWVEAGLVEQIDGPVIDYAVIEAAVVEAFERFNPQLIAYDRWNASDLVNRLLDRELPMIEFVQGFKSYHPAMQEMERLYRGGNLIHGGDPVLRWQAANLVAIRDEQNNMKPSKKRSPDKIDDMCSLLMALGVSMGQAEDGYDHEAALDAVVVSR